MRRCHLKFSDFFEVLFSELIISFDRRKKTLVGVTDFYRAKNSLQNEPFRLKFYSKFAKKLIRMKSKSADKKSPGRSRSLADIFVAVEIRNAQLWIDLYWKRAVIGGDRS